MQKCTSYIIWGGILRYQSKSHPCLGRRSFEACWFISWWLSRGMYQQLRWFYGAWRGDLKIGWKGSRGVLVVHPKLCALSGEGHDALGSRPTREHSFSLGLCLQRAAKAVPKRLFSVLWAIATYQVIFTQLWVLLGFIWCWTEVSAALQTQPVWSSADAQCSL